MIMDKRLEKTENESYRHHASQLIMESLLSLRRQVLDTGSQSQAGEHGMWWQGEWEDVKNDGDNDLSLSLGTLKYLSRACVCVCRNFTCYLTRYISFWLFREGSICRDTHKNNVTIELLLLDLQQQREQWRGGWIAKNNRPIMTCWLFQQARNRFYCNSVQFMDHKKGYFISKLANTNPTILLTWWTHRIQIQPPKMTWSKCCDNCSCT